MVTRTLTHKSLAIIVASFLIQTQHLGAVLIGHWPLDEKSGNSAHDSANGATAKNAGGGLTWKKGIIGGSATLEGEDGKTIRGLLIPSIPAMNGATALSISCWVNPASRNYHYEGIVMTRDLTDTNGNRKNWGLAMNSLLKGIPDGRVSNIPMWGENKALPLNRWSHLVMVWDSNKKTRQLYVNASPIHDPPLKAKTPTSITSSGKWYIGLDPSELDRHLRGQIDDVSIWSSALKKSQIERLYRKGLEGKNARDAKILMRQRIWQFGDISLLVDMFLESKGYDDKIMQQIAEDISQLITVCQKVTGAKPALHDPYKDTIRVQFSYETEKPDGKTGKLGMRFPATLIDDIYRDYKNGKRELPFSILRMATKNCWDKELDYRLAYKPNKGEKTHDWWMGAIARVIGAVYLNNESLTIKGADSKAIERWSEMQQAYQSDKKATWYKSYNNSRPPQAKGESLDAFLASMLFQVTLNHGGKQFMDKWLKEARKLDTLKSFRHRAVARDNFAISVSRAAGKNLAEYLNNEMKWKCSVSKVTEALKN